MTVVRLGSVLFAALTAGCGSTDPAAEIAHALAAAEQAVERRDVGFFGDLLGAGYRDARGNDREQTLALLRAYFVTHQRIEVVSRVDAVTFEGGDAARAVVHAGLLGQRAGESLLDGVDGDLYELELELVRGDGEWRVIGAAWSRAAGE